MTHKANDPRVHGVGITSYRQGMANIAKFRLGAVIVLIAALIALIVVSLKIEELIEKQYQEDFRAAAYDELIERREEVEATTFGMFLALQRLASHVLDSSSDWGEHFEHFAEREIGDSSYVTAVIASPLVGPEAAYPPGAADLLPAGQEAVLFDSQASDPEYLAAKAGLLNGPLQATDGRQVLLLRHRVLSHFMEPENEFWGVTTVVVDLVRFLERIGLSEMSRGFDILIRDESNSSMTGTIIHGDVSRNWTDALSFDFEFPNGSWEVLAIPREGWPLHSPDWLRNRIVMFGVTFFVILTLSYVLRLSELRYLAEERLNNAIRAMENGLAIFDSQGRLHKCNANFAGFYSGALDVIRPGATAREIVETIARRGIVADAIGCEDEWIAEHGSAHRRTKNYTCTDKMSNGRILRVSDHRMEDGGTVCIRSDVTELEEAVAEAQAANVTKTQFINTLSHELRTPLTVILGLAGIAKLTDRMPVVRALKTVLEETSAPPIVREKVDEVIDHFSKLVIQQEKSGQHLLSLINEMLDFAKIESGTFVVECTETPISEIVEPLEAQLEIEVNRKGLAFEVNCDEGSVYADAFRTRQILYNLIGNALKFTDMGKIVLSTERTDSHVMFHVRDTGTGIALDDIDKIFEAFRQVDSSVTRRRGGTGLGLAISRELALAQGGTISVDSELGVGSTFTLSLLAAAPTTRAREDKRDRADRGQAA